MEKITMTDGELPSPEFLRRIFVYDKKTGGLLWRKRSLSDFHPSQKYEPERMLSSWNTRRAGTKAGGYDSNGYLKVLLNGKKYANHRVIYAMCHGAWPEVEIDHINGDKSDNRIENLREVSHRDNSRNRPIRSDNSTGVNGVSRARNGKFVAQIKGNDSKVVYLGTFDSIDEAAKARAGAEISMGYHANHGRVNLSTD